jgi:hypothetical protein
LSRGALTPSRELWLGRDIDAHAGFDEALTEELRTVSEDLPWSAPWLYGPTEVYSFGRCYREWTGWPRWLPIPIYGDHGMVYATELDKHERENRARAHLTWNVGKATANTDLEDREVVLVQSPWVTFRRQHGIAPRNDRHGTLLFLAHSVPGFGRFIIDEAAISELIDEVRQNGAPIVACLHRHDLTTDIPRQLRSLGIPLVTAGSTTSPFFVERFYDLVTRFASITTDDVGSHALYCAELGIPVRLLDRSLRVRLPEEDSESMGKKALELRDLADDSILRTRTQLQDRVEEVFRLGWEEGRTEREIIVADLLAIGRGIDAAGLRRVLVREFFRTGLKEIWRERNRFAEKVKRRAGAALYRRLRAQQRP